MKNQSFHRKKIRIYDAPELDFDQLKSRTVNALSKLGQQKFSTETGGYALENWIKGLNVLLDEFEEKVGATRLSQEYLTSRNEANNRLSKPASTSSIDEGISELRARMSDIEGKVKAGRGLEVSRISELAVEQAQCLEELEQERRRVAGLTAGLSSGSLLGHLFGRKKVVTEDSDNRITELESKLAALQNDANERQKLLRMMDLRSPKSRFAEQWNELEGLQARLREMQEERLDRVQLTKVRADATRSISDAISRIP